jgi:PAS domain S-box-containing protein
MSEPGEMQTRRRATSGTLLALGVVVLAGGVWLRMDTMRRQQVGYWRAALAGGAITTQLTVDDWYGERVADAEGTAEAVLQRVQLGGGWNPRQLERQLLLAERRGRAVGVWIVDRDGRPLGASRPDTLYEAERVAARAAARSGRTGHSGLVAGPGGSTALTVAAPVRAGAAGAGRPAVVLLRTDIVASFSPWATGPNSALSLLATPAAEGYVVVRICPGERPPICVSTPRTLDPASPAALALAGRDTFGTFTSAEGRVLAATRRDSTLGWGIVRRVPVHDAFALLRHEAAIEGAFLAVLLALAGVGAFATTRVSRLRRLHARVEADARLSLVVDASIDGLLSFDGDLRISLANAAVCRLFGRERESLRGLLVTELFVPEQAAALAGRLAQLRAAAPGLSSGTGEGDRYTALRADGGRFPVSVVLGRAEVEGAPPLFTMGVHDLSERRRAEEFLRRQQEVLELIASGPTARAGLTAVIGLLEREAPGVQCAAYELQDDRVVLTLVAAPSLPEDFAIATEEMIAGPVNDAVGTAVFRGEPVFTPDVATDSLWARSRACVTSYGLRAGWAIPLRGADGVLIGAMAFYIGEAREATQREVELSNAAVHLGSIALASARDAALLRGSEASFRSFVENAPAAIFRETRLGHLVSANQAMVALLGYPHVQALTTAGDAGLLYHDPGARRALLASLEADDLVRGVEVDWRRADRSRVTVRLSARAYRDDRGRVWLWEGYAEDVTALRQAEEALRRSEKLAAVGQLISGVAHELNNPLSSILHFAEDLLSDPRTRDDAEALGVIRDQARRSRAIVRDLLSFVQQREANVQVVTLGATVAATARAMLPGAQRMRVALHVEHLDDVDVHVDRTGLEQIVTNLLSNAMHAAGAGGEVRVRTECAVEWCRLVVEDSGPGIAADVLPRIFDPFFTTKPTGEGTGLGLSVTLGIVQQFGGRVVTEPLPPGVRGTRFVVTIPLTRGGSPSRVAQVAPAPAAPAAAPRPVAAPSGAGPAPRSVLVIDDEATIRGALRRFFVRRGWLVEEAEEGRAALAMIAARAGGYQLVVSDLRMPGLSGVQLHDHLAAHDPGLLRRVVFSTGDVASREAASFVQRTTCPVLQKPFELGTLDELIARLDEGTVPAGVVG